MNFFNFRSGRHGDTPEKMQQLTAQGVDDLVYTLSAIEAVARDAAACVLDGAAEYQIGGTIPAVTNNAGRAPSQDLRV